MNFIALLSKGHSPAEIQQIAFKTGYYLVLIESLSAVDFYTLGGHLMVARSLSTELRQRLNTFQ